MQELKIGRIYKRFKGDLYLVEISKYRARISFELQNFPSVGFC